MMFTFLFYTRNAIGKFGPKISKLSVKVEICYPDYLEYEEFNGGALFFCSRLEIPFLKYFVQKIKIVSLSCETWYQD